MKFAFGGTEKKFLHRIAAAALAGLFIISALPAAAENAADFEYDRVSPADGAPSYTDYIAAYKDAETPEQEIILPASSAGFEKNGKSYTESDYKQRGGVSLYNAEGESSIWNLNVSQEGLYILKLVYYPVEGDGGSMERRLKIDGNVPFSEADRISFARLWSNSDEKPALDTQGNEIMIEQMEVPEWTEQYAEDSSGLSNEPLNIYLTAGTHTLELYAISEPMMIGEVRLEPLSSVAVKPYKEVYSGYADRNPVSKEAEIILQGESADVKSTQMLYPVSDRTSPTVVPYSASKIVYNAIGGSQWSNTDQWVEWKFTAEESGLYALSAHFKQSFKEGRGCTRRVLIDGKAPFKEAESWLFPYGTTWQSDYLSDKDGEPYALYLEKGEHTIRLEITLGDYNEVIQRSSSLLSELNGIYRQIIAVTGANPDQYRDYRFSKTIPETIEQMKTVSEKLKQLEKDILEIEGNASSLVDVKRLYTNIDLMLRDTDKISVRLSAFKDNIASFGTWINNQRGQPLMLDWIKLSSPSEPLSRGEAGFFSLAAHYIKGFCASFVTDYSTVGETDLNSDDAITVWMTTSQDQAQILRQLVNTDFTPNTGIAAQVQLVATSALLPAILAHKGPDAVLGMAQADVNNLALRNAIENLLEYADGDWLSDQFHNYSLDAFRFEDGIYAIPETQMWPMLFYRKDILKELGIKQSDLTRWDLILETVLPKLKKSSLDFGLMPSIDNYTMMLYQRGGEIYKDGGRSSALSSSEAVDSMKVFSILYREYGFQLAFDFPNRFRNGEMPVAVVDFSMYNNLTMFAGEIKNLWGMLPVPGTVDDTGKINHTAVTRANGTVLMSDSENKKAAWSFIEWWTSAEVQNLYGKRLEAVVGTAARYNPANKKAMAEVRWDPDMKESLLYQAENLKAFPEVPGGYFTQRLFDFSFRKIVYDDQEVRKTLSDMADDIDVELINKREEYNLD